MVQKFPTTAAYTSPGPDRANLISAQKNFEDLFTRAMTLEAKVTALEAKATALQTKITAVETDLEAKAIALQTKITAVEADLEAESKALQTKITAVQADLEAKATALQTKISMVSTSTSSAVSTLSTAASVASGGTVYVPGSEADPFVIGASMGLGKVLITEPDGTIREARDGKDFYWNRDAQPIFFKDLEVVSVTKVGGNSEYYPDGGLPPNRAGYVSTNYSNGHSMLEEIPLAEWNPPLAAMNELPKGQARALLDEYTNSRGITFMTTGDYDQLGSFYSDDYRSFLESKGVTGPATPPVDIPPGD